MEISFEKFDQRLKWKSEDTSFKNTYLNYHYSEEANNKDRLKCLACMDYFPEIQLGKLKVFPNQIKVESYVLYIPICSGCKVIGMFENEDFILDILSLNSINQKKKFDFEIDHIQDIRDIILIDLRNRMKDYIKEGLDFFANNEDKRYLYHFGELLVDFLSLLLDNTSIFNSRKDLYTKLIFVLAYVWKREDYFPEKNYAYRGLGDDIFLMVKYILALEENLVLSEEKISEILTELIIKTKNSKVKEIGVKKRVFLIMKESVSKRRLFMNDIVYGQLRTAFDFV